MAVAMATLCSCAASEPVPTPAAGPTTFTIGPSERAVDSRILGVLDAGCSKLSAEAVAGIRGAVDPEVRRLAETIQADCSSFQKSQRSLTSSLGLDLGASEVRTSLQASTAERVAEISSQDHEAFDRVFLDRIIADQEEILGISDGTLLKTANYSQVETLVDEDFNRSLRSNLARARELRTLQRE